MARLSEIDFFRSILDNLHVAVYVVDREGKILFWNDGAERITGYLRQDVIGRLHTDNFLGETNGEDNELTGTNAPTTTAMIDEASGVLNHGVTQSHIGENIRLFEEHHVPFSILCMEMDHLDKVMQRDGPGAIAVILRVVGQTLENTVRPTDYLGRWQSNQFLAILTECSGNEIERASERLRRMVNASKIAWWDDRVPVTISVGGTVVKHGDTVEAMVMRAERALRESVAEGGNRTKVRYD